MDDFDLIKLVKEQPAIYDTCDQNYHNHFRKDIIWEGIADQLDATAEDCKKRWQSLREGYRKSLKKRCSKPYRYNEEMEFLLEYLGDIEKIKSDEEGADPLKLKFVDIDEEELIELVKSRPELYDTNNKGYHNQIIRDSKWEEISKILKVDMEECRQKWRSLRDCYRKALKNRVKFAGTPRANKRWRLESPMEFIKYFLVNDRINSTAIVFNEEQDDSTSDRFEQEYNKEYNKVEETQRPDHLTKYFQAAEETLRTFPLELQIQAKKKISEIIHDFELAALKMNTDS